MIDNVQRLLLNVCSGFEFWEHPVIPMTGRGGQGKRAKETGNRSPEGKIGRGGETSQAAEQATAQAHKTWTTSHEVSHGEDSGPAAG
jgi:hypothetical protein